MFSCEFGKLKNIFFTELFRWLLLDILIFSSYLTSTSPNTNTVYIFCICMHLCFIYKYFLIKISEIIHDIITFQIQKKSPKAFVEKGVLQNFAKFTGKHLLTQVFSFKFGKIFKNIILQNIAKRLLLEISP